MTSNLERAARDAATRFRDQHGLGVAPLGDLVALIELTQNIDVAILDTGPDKHGMTARDPVRGSVIVAAARTPHPMRQRSTLAHELAHIIFDDYAIPPAQGGWGRRDPKEIRADNFARHLLVPTEALAHRAANYAPEQTSSLSALSALVQHFQASPAIVAIQLGELGLISSDLKAEWSARSGPSASSLASKHGWSDQYRALQEESNTRRAPQRLLARAIDGYQRGVVSIAYIARLRGRSVSEIEEEFAQQGIAPQPPDEAAALETVALLPPEDDLPAIDLSELDSLGLDDQLPDDD